MQFSILSVALCGSMAFAAPAENLVARASCQFGDIWGAGDAACSISVCFLNLLNDADGFSASKTTPTTADTATKRGESWIY